MNPITEKALEALNSAFAADPIAVSSILDISVSCNQQLADHPSVQVGGYDDGGYYVRVIGLINGMIEPMCGERIAMVLENGKLTGFCLYIEKQ